MVLNYSSSKRAKERTKMRTNGTCKMHVCLRALMRLCRWAGLFPVEGLDKLNICSLKFNLKSFYALYYFTTFISQAYLAGVNIYCFSVNEPNLTNLKNLIFHLTGLFSTLLLLILARNWPKLLRKAADIEHFTSDILCSETVNSRKYYRTTCIVMGLALLEHILSVTYKIKMTMESNKQFVSILDVIRKYFNNTSYCISQLTMYSTLLYEVAILQATFVWNFTDVMTICVSMYLTGYFQQLNNLIEKQEKQKIIKWAEIRILYSHLVQLVKLVDANTCYLILLSFFTNLFFICAQLFHLMSSVQGIEHFLYYFYSFSFLFIRACITSLLAANIHSVSRRPLSVLQHVPATEYSIEVQRMIRQIRYSTTALSGVFFYITRSMMLNVIANIVKYELVILQFALRQYEAIKKIK